MKLYLSTILHPFAISKYPFPHFPQDDPYELLKQSVHKLSCIHLNNDMFCFNEQLWYYCISCVALFTTHSEIVPSIMFEWDPFSICDLQNA